MRDLPTRVSCVVFDCDGVLVDTEPIWAASEHEVIAGYGARLDHEHRKLLLGSSWDDSLVVLAGVAGTDDVDELGRRLLTIAQRRLRTETVPLPGARDVLQALAGRVPCGVGSNARPDNLRIELECAGLAQYADVMISGDEVAQPKPAPDVYLEVCHRLGADPTQALGVEDSPPGAHALIAAGTPTVVIPTLPDAPIEHDWRFDSLEQLVDWARTVEPLGR